jgi:hypothetical protein
MSKEDKKEPGYALGTEVDGSDSIDTITALVAEGTDHLCGTTTFMLTSQQTTDMTSSFEPCPGIRLLVCLQASRSA